MKSKRLEFVAPILFWVILLAVHLIRTIPLISADRVGSYLVTLAITFPMDFVTFSFFYFFISPRILRKKNVALMVVLGLLFWIFYGLIWDVVYYLAGRIDSQAGFIAIYKSSFGHIILHTLYAVVLRFAVDWIRKYRVQKELEKQNTIIELALLRSQVNPHFLFNVLNNIHSFVHTDPDKTSFSLIKLSEIMRYMLYESNNETVPLEKEIAYIENYLSLQKIRLQEKESVRFKVLGDPAGIHIAPLIFISFVENAFKHGKKNIRNGIDIRLEIHRDQLRFYCLNQVRQLTESEEKGPESIGLKNIYRRLELLYPNRHTISIVHDEEKYEVSLIIDLP